MQVIKIIFIIQNQKGLVPPMIYIWIIFSLIFLSYMYNKTNEKLKDLDITEDKKKLILFCVSGFCFLFSITLLFAYFGLYKLVIPGLPAPINKIPVILVVIFLIDVLYLRIKYPQAEKLEGSQKETFIKHLATSLVVFIISLCILPVVLGVVLWTQA